jgi:cysteine synthase A
MVKIAKQLTELIGNTPLLELGRYSQLKGLETPIVAKVEFFNPGGSAKDRIAVAMVDDAEQKGLLKPGATIIEPTSGNTGVGLALVSAVRGYHLILTMPETMSQERRNLVRAYGADVRLTPGRDGMQGAIDEAQRLCAEIPGSIILGQFDNPANPESHYLTTGPEIWQQTDGRVDIFVAGVGTGGTISGVARYLKQQRPDVTVVGVEPLSSAVLNGKPAGAHKIQGIGAGFIPKTYDASLVDEVLPIADDDAIRAGRELARTDGLLVGISSGAAVAGAVQIARRPENRGKCIVALLPDTGERYLSTVLYAFDEYPL